MEKEEYILNSLARMQQIKKNLLQIEKDENEVCEAIKSKLLKAENGFLRAKIELYNEKCQIESKLVHIGATEPPESKSQDIVELAKYLDLKTKLRDAHLAEASMSRCWTNCVECVTKCTECVTSCGLSGDASGGCGISSLVSSTCKPKPDVFD